MLNNPDGWLIGVYALICDSRFRILLIHRADSDIWQSPGGGVDYPECPSSAVVREVQEETGFDCEVVQLVGVDFGLESRNVWLTYECRITGGHANLSDESDGIGFFPVEALPPVTPATALRVRKYFSQTKGCPVWSTEIPDL